MAIISATGGPIHFMFGSRIGFSGSADRIALFLVTSNPSWRRAAILDNFEWPYLRNGSFDPHRVVIFAIAQLSCSVSCWLSVLGFCVCFYILGLIFADIGKFSYGWPAFLSAYFGVFRNCGYTSISVYLHHNK